MRYLRFIACCIFLANSVFAQSDVSARQPKEKTPMNQYDGKGKKNGMWLIRKVPRMGEPGFSEFGSYDHGIRYGTWYRIDEQGELVSIENYRNNVLDGEVRYYEKGQLYCVGHYRGLNPSQDFDTIVVTDPVTQMESYRVIGTEQGTMRHGNWSYFNPATGSLVREEEYQVDELVLKREYGDSRDSTLRKLHEKRMPHVKDVRYTPPPGKKISYTRP